MGEEKINAFDGKQKFEEGGRNTGQILHESVTIGGLRHRARFKALNKK